MKTALIALRSDQAYPLMTLTLSLTGLTVMGLANLSREAVPAWHGPMGVLLAMLFGLALRDLVRLRGRGRHD